MITDIEEGEKALRVDGQATEQLLARLGLNTRSTRQTQAEQMSLTQKHIARYLTQPAILRDPHVRTLLAEVCCEVEEKREISHGTETGALGERGAQGCIFTFTQTKMVYQFYKPIIHHGKIGLHLKPGEMID